MNATRKPYFQPVANVYDIYSKSLCDEGVISLSVHGKEEGEQDEDLTRPWIWFDDEEEEEDFE